MSGKKLSLNKVQCHNQDLVTLVDVLWTSQITCKCTCLEELEITMKNTTIFGNTHLKLISGKLFSQLILMRNQLSVEDNKVLFTRIDSCAFLAEFMKWLMSSMTWWYLTLRHKPGTKLLKTIKIQTNSHRAHHIVILNTYKNPLWSKF